MNGEITIENKIEELKQKIHSIVIRGMLTKFINVWIGREAF